MMLKLKLQYFGHLMWRVDSLEKTHARRDWGQEEKGTTEDEMAGWHHWLNGREFVWTLGVDDGQGGLACCDSWGSKESDTTEWLIWSDLISPPEWTWFLLTRLFEVRGSFFFTFPLAVYPLKSPNTCFLNELTKLGKPTFPTLSKRTIPVLFPRLSGRERMSQLVR